jgi:hypothetical protein
MAVSSAHTQAQCAAEHGPCAGPQGTFDAWDTHVRINGVNRHALLPLSPNVGDEFTAWSGIVNGMPQRCICGLGHKTSCNRGFEHFHVNIPFPATGRWAIVRFGDEARLMVIHKQWIEDYWDWEYLQDGFQRVAGTGWDPSINCHGYSMGLGGVVKCRPNCFPQIIQPDDWAGGSLLMTDYTLRIANEDHSAKVTHQYVQGPMGYTLITSHVSEKFADSPIYEKSDAVNGVSPKTQIHYENAPHVLTWGTNYARTGQSTVGPPPVPPSGGGGGPGGGPPGP